MKNNCNYSDKWQPYINDYDKFEYDIKLKNGTIIENCYPNGGEFNSISDLHDGQCFGETEVLEIRFSEKPRYGINGDVSEQPQYEHLDKIEEGIEYKRFYKAEILKAITANVRPEPKIRRNEICPKCESGLKYKRCCGFLK